MKALICTIFLAILWPVCALATTIEEFRFYKITTNEGLSHSTVYAIVQDHKGFMWFGTRAGLNRFDGEQVITFYADPHNTPGLCSNTITALAVGPSGLLYVGTSQGLSVYDQEHEVFHRLSFHKQSLGYINKIFVSEDSSIFIGSANGLYIKREDQVKLEKIVDGVNIFDIIEFKKDVFWVSTPEKILMINSFGEIIKQYTTISSPLADSVRLRQNISCFYKDSDGQVWLGTKQNGLFKYNDSKDWFEPVFNSHGYNALEVNIIRSISEDLQHNLWIGTESGLFIYDIEANKVKWYGQSYDKSATKLNDEAIYSIYRSKEGIMWLGTYFGGVNMARPEEKGFHTLVADGGKQYLSGKAISQIMEDRKGRIWIATEDGGVNIWNRAEDTMRYLRNIPGENSLSVNNVHALYQDEDGMVWIGTFLGGLNKYNPVTGKVTVFENRWKNSSFQSSMVYAIHQDINDTLWIGTQGGLNIFDKKEKVYKPFRPDIFKGKFIYDIYEEQSGQLWFCVMNADSIYRYDPRNGKLERYRYDYSRNAVTKHGVISALEDSKGNMWFGTVGQGLLLFDSMTHSFQSFTVADGLPNNYVYGILEDSEHNLWLSTNKGLSRFDVGKEEFKNFDISHGLPNNQFNFRSAFESDDGWMFFGTINGLCYFHPDSLSFNNMPPQVYFSGLKLFNSSVPIGDQSILSKSINATKSITLEYADNVITIDYAAINYFSLGNNQFAYYMEGFEPDWNYVGDKKSATYTNLSPGDYVFKVKAANNNGLWSEAPRTLKIHVLPPFWMTPWAIVLYVAVLTGLILLYRAFLNYRNKEKMAIRIERLEREKALELNKHKINFFTYISHEFKTPLTLIIASIDKFLQGEPTSIQHMAGYRSIKRNAKRLHFLIDQLMEFRRVETNHAKVNFDKGDVILFMKDTFYAFAPLFNRKNIEFHFSAEPEKQIAYFDSDKLEKIVTNLISNAAKYTPAEGLVEMKVNIISAEHGDTLNVVISDTGLGINEDEVGRVFTDFYQTEQGRITSNGTGIGMAMVKSLVTFLKGDIHIESDHYNGTKVTVGVPLPIEPKGQAVRFIQGNKTLDIGHELYDEEGELSEAHRGTTRLRPAKYKLLIVEDNREIVSFLARHFSTNYSIARAFNGREALAKVEKAVPDIIISDVMMPKMDGIEFCRQIKGNVNTSHIPLVLLTAKATLENRLRGLDEGADAYISKPFNLQELELTIKNLLESRNRLKSHFLKYGNLNNTEIPINNRDQDFLIKLTNIVEDHLDDSDFNITAFTKAAGVSRTLLHIKLKKLANLSASEFIKTIRLQHAEELLKNADFTVSEIAYKVGYSDPSYFSRTFKEKYKVNPTEFRSQFATKVD